MKPQDIQNLQEAYSQVYELDEVSQKTATRAFAARATDAFEADDSDAHDKAEKTKERIVKKHGKAAGQHAERAAHAKIFGRKKTALTSMPPKPTKTDEAVDLHDIILSHSLDEAEGSYGQTPKAQQKMGELTNKRRNTPASEYSERGEKKKKVDAASRHFNRMGNPDAGDRSKKSTKPTWHSASRQGMTQKDRDHARGEAEYGHTGYDPDWDGPASGPGGKPKGKKAERQKKTGVSAESFDLYDIILSHLLDEGYASTEESADKIILNMSESWFEEIVEARRSEKEGKGSPESPLSYPGRSVQKERGEMGGRHWKSGGEGGSKTERGRKKSDKYSQSQRLRGLSTYPEKPGKYAEMQRKRRGGDIGSRYD
jgi:hypothetical protein